MALTAFVRSSQAEVWRLCAYLGDRDDADDLTQETFLRAINALPSFRRESSARTWLLSIARFTCADAVRRSVRQRRLVDRLATRRIEAEPDPSGRADLESSIATLTDDRRAAFVLTQILGMSYAEAAQICDCPVGTIRSRVARAREDLVEMVTGGEAGTPSSDADEPIRYDATGDV